MLPSSAEALRAVAAQGITLCLATGKARPGAVRAMEAAGLAGGCLAIFCRTLVGLLWGAQGLSKLLPRPSPVRPFTQWSMSCVATCVVQGLCKSAFLQTTLLLQNEPRGWPFPLKPGTHAVLCQGP